MSKINLNRGRMYTVASSFVCTSPLTVKTVVGVLDTRMVSNTSKFRSFLLSMCIDVLESTANVLSSGVFEDGAGSDQTCESEWNVASSVSLSLTTLFAIPQCISAGGRIFIVARFLPEFCPQISEHKSYAREVHTF